MTHCIIQNTNITIIETKIINLIYSEAVCIIPEECTANGIKKESAELKTNVYLKKLRPVIVTFRTYYYLFINWIDIKCQTFGRYGYIKKHRVITKFRGKYLKQTIPSVFLL